MKKVFNRKSFSLLELIVATVLVIFVILGIFAINSVLSNSNQDFGQRYAVKSLTQVTLNHILNNASEAIGSGTNFSLTDDSGNTIPDQGIVFGTDTKEGWSSPYNPAVADQYSVCIHQDISSSAPDSTTANTTPTTPPLYTSSSPAETSRWLCYTWYPSGMSCPASISNCAYQIWYCTSTYTYNSGTHIPNSRNAGSCYNNASQEYLGTAFTNPFSTPSPASFTTTNGFSITLTNCLDNTQSCPSTNNPQQVLTGNVFPPQEGIQQN